MVQIPPPSDWQDFERLCRDLWSRIWDDDNAQRHSRDGQRQDGVDIFGRPHGGTAWSGVQCKLKDHEHGRLKPAEIEAEVEKARKFNPSLSEYVVATTAKRDHTAQEAARKLSGKHGFSVTVFAWQDIAEHLEKHQEVRAQHYPNLRLAGAGSKRAARKDYLGALWDSLYPVRLLGLGRDSTEAEDVPLAEVYTALDVTAELSVAGREGVLETWGSTSKALLRPTVDYWNRLEARLRHEAEATAKGRPGKEPYRRRVTALEMAAATPRLVLLGPAGSGKSTFVRHLALCLAGEALGRAGANLDRLEDLSEGQERDADLSAWPHGAVLPAFVELKQLVTSTAFPTEGEDATAEQLLAYLESLGPGIPDTRAFLRDAFEKPGGALLILDGLDETPGAEQCRKRLRQMIASFCRRFPHCHVLVTCRPYAYEPGSAWRLENEGFDEASLAPFTHAKARAFIAAWYAHLVSRRQIEAEQAKQRSDALWREIKASPHLTPLAERPLLLTMMANLHASSGGRLPGGRAGLYEESVKLLLDRWNKVRGLLDRASLSEHLGMSVKQLRHALEDLAYDVHRQRAKPEAPRQPISPPRNCSTRSTPIVPGRSPSA